jgi:hypothetical protein
LSYLKSSVFTSELDKLRRRQKVIAAFGVSAKERLALPGSVVTTKPALKLTAVRQRAKQHAPRGVWVKPLVRSET